MSSPVESQHAWHIKASELMYTITASVVMHNAFIALSSLRSFFFGGGGSQPLECGGVSHSWHDSGWGVHVWIEGGCSGLSCFFYFLKLQLS